MTARVAQPQVYALRIVKLDGQLRMISSMRMRPQDAQHSARLQRRFDELWNQRPQQTHCWLEAVAALLADDEQVTVDLFFGERPLARLADAPERVAAQIDHLDVLAWALNETLSVDGHAQLAIRRDALKIDRLTLSGDDGEQRKERLQQPACAGLTR